MSATRSPTTGRHYPLTQVCAVYRVPRSTAYTAAARTTAAPESSGAKRGPKTPAFVSSLSSTRGGGVFDDRRWGNFE